MRILRLSVFLLIVPALFLLFHLGHSRPEASRVPGSRLLIVRSVPMSNPQVIKGGAVVSVPLATGTGAGTSQPASTSQFNLWLSGVKVIADTSWSSLPVTVNGFTVSLAPGTAGVPISFSVQLSGSTTLALATGYVLNVFGPTGSSSTGLLDIVASHRKPLILDTGTTREITAADAVDISGALYLTGSLVAPFVNVKIVTAAYAFVPNVDTFIVLNTTSGTLTATLPDPTNYNGPCCAVGCTGTGGASGSVATAGSGKTITGSATVSQGSTRYYYRLADGSGWWQG